MYHYFRIGWSFIHFVLDGWLPFTSKKRGPSSAPTFFQRRDAAGSKTLPSGKSPPSHRSLYFMPPGQPGLVESGEFWCWMLDDFWEHLPPLRRKAACFVPGAVAASAHDQPMGVGSPKMVSMEMLVQSVKASKWGTSPSDMAEGLHG